MQRSFDFALISLRSTRPSLRMTSDCAVAYAPTPLRMTPAVKVIDDRGIESLKIVEVK
jgi:hypothetical protein